MESEEVHNELKAAETAMNQCRYDAAFRLLDTAAHGGAEPLHISDMGRRIRAARVLHEKRVRGSVRVGFLIALAGYFILMWRQPLGWTTPVWVVFGFVVIPAAAGLFVGRRHAGERSPAAAFIDGARAGVYAMMCYSGINILMLVGKLHEDSSQAVDEYFAGLLTVLLFSVAAGAVAGLVSAAVSRISQKGEPA